MYGNIVPVDFARQLETELNKANQDAEELAKSLKLFTNQGLALWNHEKRIKSSVKTSDTI